MNDSTVYVPTKAPELLIPVMFVEEAPTLFGTWKVVQE
jgi:hypothetical protein